MHQLRTLGGIDLRDPAGREVQALLAQPKRLALLVYLALAPSRYRRRDSVLALFWPEADTEHARASLRQALRYLRRTLGDQIVSVRSEEEVGIGADSLQCDAVLLVEASRDRDWNRVAELYAGSFLEGFHVAGAATELDEWIEGERSRLRQIACDAAWALADDALRRGDGPGAVRFGREGLRLSGDADMAAERFRQLTAVAQPLVPAPPGSSADPSRELSPTRLPASGDRRPDTRSSRFRGLGRAAAAMLLVVAAAFAGARALRPGSLDGALPRPTVAMAPLVNATGDTALDYLAVGLAEAITGRLAASTRVTVAGRSAAIGKDPAPSPLEEGRIRGADAVLAGRLLRVDSGLALEVELHRVSDSSRMWTERYPFPLRDVLQVEDRVTQSVLARVDTVRGVLHEDGERRPLPADHEAHLLVLRGAHERLRRNPASFQRARDLYLRALERDPVYAEAYAGLSGTYQGLAHYGVMPGREAFPRARAAALRALQLDSTLAEARTGLAAVRTFHDWDFAGAEREYQEALRLDPNDTETRNFYGIHLRILGRFDEAERQMEAASRLDPLASVYVRQIAFVRFCAGNYAGALAEFRHAVELEPGSRTARREAVTTLATMGRFDEAIDAWRRDSLNDMPNELRALLARARGEEGYRAARRTQASLVLDQVRSRSKDRYAPPASLAHAHAILGQWDSTLVWLERAADDRDPAVLKVSCEREYDPIRSHPRFQALLRRLGLGA